MLDSPEAGNASAWSPSTHGFRSSQHHSMAVSAWLDVKAPGSKTSIPVHGQKPHHLYDLGREVT